MSMLSLPHVNREWIRATPVEATQREHDEASAVRLSQRLVTRGRQPAQGPLCATSDPLQRALDNLKTTQHRLVQTEKQVALGSIVAAVSHELNTPIGNCLTVASTLEEKCTALHKALETGISRSQLASYLQDTRTATQLLLRGLRRAAELVINFKQLAVGQSDSQRRRFALRGVVGGVVAPLHDGLRNTPYHLEIDIPVALTMDSYPDAIEQIVSNLINNSILHGFAGRDHGVMRLCATSDDNAIHLTYSDNGRGMSAHVLRHIFDPFFTTTLGKGGSGLGMSVCYNLVTGPLGGSIEVQSSEAQGCVFTILLPRMAPD